MAINPTPSQALRPSYSPRRTAASRATSTHAELVEGRNASHRPQLQSQHHGHREGSKERGQARINSLHAHLDQHSGE